MPSEQPSMSPIRATENYLVSQYESLRTEQIEKIKETHVILRRTIIANGAVWAWIIINYAEIQTSWPQVSSFIVLIPLVVAILFPPIYLSLRKDVRVIGRTIAAMEEHFEIPLPLRWESNVEETVTSTRAVHLRVYYGLAAINALGVVIILVVFLTAANG
jgi:hypothetical protein